MVGEGGLVVACIMNISWTYVSYNLWCNILENKLRRKKTWGENVRWTSHKKHSELVFSKEIVENAERHKPVLNK